ncbi:response regulator transcription factor [Candidatus Gracilibacteria bacterium]|nr:response regulator transcription factor [Candidatus Gracilibacteria bacterium]
MHITIIEDEKILSNNIAKKLNRNGYNTKIFNSYNEFINENNLNSDLYIIDISLNDGNGFDIIKHIRSKRDSKTPIIITSGYWDLEKKIYGLDLGADDYLAKPYSIEELEARIRALIRRSYEKTNNSEIKYNDLIFNFNEKIIKKNGVIIDLTSKEIQFVEYMILNIGKPVKKIDIINSVWGKFDEIDVTDNTINVTISKIRKKLGKSFNLKTMVNRGYMLK